MTSTGLYGQRRQVLLCFTFLIISFFFFLVGIFFSAVEHCEIFKLFLFSGNVLIVNGCLYFLSSLSLGHGNISGSNVDLILCGMCELIVVKKNFQCNSGKHFPLTLLPTLSTGFCFEFYSCDMIFVIWKIMEKFGCVALLMFPINYLEILKLS